MQLKGPFTQDHDWSSLAAGITQTQSFTKNKFFISVLGVGEAMEPLPLKPQQHKFLVTGVEVMCLQGRSRQVDMTSVGTKVVVHLKTWKTVLGLRELLLSKSTRIGMWMLNLVKDALRIMQRKCNCGHWSRKCSGVSGCVGHPRPCSSSVGGHQGM